MNSKLLLILICTLTACGVKSPPKPPIGTDTPSYIDKYIKPLPPKKKREKNKKEKK